MGLLYKIEDEYLCPCVIRGYQSQCAGVKLSSSSLEAEQDEEHAHQQNAGTFVSPTLVTENAEHPVEITAMGHLEKMNQMGYISDASYRSKKSLFDYGSRF